MKLNKVEEEVIKVRTDEVDKSIKTNQEDRKDKPRDRMDAYRDIMLMLAKNMTGLGMLHENMNRTVIFCGPEIEDKVLIDVREKLIDVYPVVMEAWKQMLPYVTKAEMEDEKRKQDMKRSMQVNVFENEEHEHEGSVVVPYVPTEKPDPRQII